MNDHWGIGVVGYLSYGEFSTPKISTPVRLTNKSTGAQIIQYIDLPSANIDYLILGAAFSATYN